MEKLDYRKLKAARQSSGMTQKQLAKLAELRPETVSRLENRAHSAEHLTVVKLASALNLDVKDLIADELPIESLEQ